MCRLQGMETGDIVSAAFSSQTEKTSTEIPPEQIETEEGRRDLFDNLLKRMNNEIKAKSLLDLLKIWPPFEAEVILFQSDMGQK